MSKKSRPELSVQGGEKDIAAKLTRLFLGYA